MIIGEKEVFAIYYKINDVIDDWVLGSFFIWIKGKLLGNIDDNSVDLKGCAYWINNYLNIKRDRYEIGLYEMSKEQIYLQLASSILPNENKEGFAKPLYDNIFSRFHITQIGMSSFDNAVLILVEDGKGGAHIVWKYGDDIFDAYLTTHIINETFSNFILKMKEFDKT